MRKSNRVIGPHLPKHKKGCKPTVPHVRGPDTPDGEETLFCRECKEAKPLWRMHKNQGCKSVSNLCKTCKRAQNNWRSILAGGCTYEKYDEMLKAQGGVCALCHLPQREGYCRKRLNVDHDHVTGQIRALLCHGCNVSLGHFDDDPARLRAAAEYLEKHRALQIVRPALVDVCEPPGNGGAVGAGHAA